MTRRRKWTLIGIGAVVAGGVLYSMLNPTRIDVDVADVRSDTLSVTVDEQGITRAMERFTIAAPVTGRITRARVKEGDAIRVGDILTTIAPPPPDPRARTAARADVTAAEARRNQMSSALAEAKGVLDQAERELERRRQLLAQGALSREQLEQYTRAAEGARDRHAAAEAALTAADADLQAARARLLGADLTNSAVGAVPIEAPVAGTVLRVLEESERVVQAGTALFELANAAGLEVLVDVLTEDAVSIQPGAPMRVTGWGGSDVLEGRVRRVEPAAFTKVSALGVEEQRVNVIADLHDPPVNLGAGYRVDAHIITWQGSEVLVVPTSALFRRSGGWRTFVVEDGRARLRAVEIGHRAADRAEVLTGLEAGDRVIVFPSDQIVDAVRVRTQTNR